MSYVKSILVTLLCTAVLLNFSGCSEMFEVVHQEEKHTIYLFFPTAVYLDEPDTLDIYGDGELIKTITTEGKAVENIEYNALGYSERVTVYSHALEKTYECDTIEEYIKDIEDVICEAGDMPMTNKERAETCATMCVAVGIDYQREEMFEYDDQEAYNDWVAGVCKVNFIFKNSEMAKGKKLRLVVFYNYKDTSCLLTGGYVENILEADVVPQNTESISYRIKNEEYETLIEGQCEVNGKTSVDIVIDFAECAD